MMTLYLIVFKVYANRNRSQRRQLQTYLRLKRVFDVNRLWLMHRDVHRLHVQGGVFHNIGVSII